MLNTQTKLFAILGYPIKHSFSPQMQNGWFQKEGLNCVYLAFEPEPKNLERTIEALKTLNFYGLNVTIPYKTQILKYIDVLDEAAKKIGSINTIVFKDSKLYGYNTDYLGFSRDLMTKRINLVNKNVLIIGSGGASRAVIYALKNARVKSIHITNRTMWKAKKLAKEFNINSFDIKDMEALLTEIDLLVNTSSCGMKETDALPFSFCKVKESLIVYDLIYGKATPFLKFANDKCLKFFTGSGMLLYQGAYAFEIWTGKYPDIKIAEDFLKNFV